MLKGLVQSGSRPSWVSSRRSAHWLGPPIPRTERMRAALPDVVALVVSIGVMLVWAGAVEAFISQSSPPRLGIFQQDCVWCDGASCSWFLLALCGSTKIVTPTLNLRVETPEGIVFSFPLASPLTRALAYSIDFAAIAAGAGILAKGVRIIGILGPDWVAAFSVLASFVISLAYGIFLEWHWRGQTLGKRVLRLRVIDARGLRLEFTQVVVRNLLRAVDMLPILYLTGAVAAFVTSKGQRLGDLAAGTIVVHEPNIAPPDLEHSHPRSAIPCQPTLTWRQSSVA